MNQVNKGPGPRKLTALACLSGLWFAVACASVPATSRGASTPVFSARAELIDQVHEQSAFTHWVGAITICAAIVLGAIMWLGVNGRIRSAAIYFAGIGATSWTVSALITRYGVVTTEVIMPIALGCIALLIGLTIPAVRSFITWPISFIKALFLPKGGQSGH